MFEKKTQVKVPQYQMTDLQHKGITLDQPKTDSDFTETLKRSAAKISKILAKKNPSENLLEQQLISPVSFSNYQLEMVLRIIKTIEYKAVESAEINRNLIKEANRARQETNRALEKIGELEKVKDRAEENIEQLENERDRARNQRDIYIEANTKLIEERKILEARISKFESERNLNKQNLEYLELLKINAKNQKGESEKNRKDLGESNQQQKFESREHTKCIQANPNESDRKIRNFQTTESTEGDKNPKKPLIDQSNQKEQFQIMFISNLVFFFVSIIISLVPDFFQLIDCRKRFVQFLATFGLSLLGIGIVCLINKRYRKKA